MIKVFIICILTAACAVNAQGDPLSYPLIQRGDLQYEGAFKLPDNTQSIGNSYHYAQGAIAFCAQSTVFPNRPSLFVACHRDSGKLSEIIIPELVITTDKDSLNSASVIQACQEPLRSAYGGIINFPGRLGGVMVWHQRLVFSVFKKEPGGGCDVRSHFKKNSHVLSNQDVYGPNPLANIPGPCYVNGPMTMIPVDFQPLLGKKESITFQCCQDDINTTSWGPAAFAFNPEDIAHREIVTVPLQYYNSAHPTLGNPTGAGSPLKFEAPWNNSWNNTAVPGYRGLVIPNGTRSALYFTAQGTGDYNVNNGSPYRFQIMAFDLKDWVDVARGIKEPWQVLPYAVWPLTAPDLPFADGLNDVAGGGATYDSINNRIYWEQSCAHGDSMSLPIIHAWKVNTGLVNAKPEKRKRSWNKLEVYPNPFNPAVTISYHGLKKNADVNIYNLGGALVKQLKAFNRSVTWDGTDGSGSRVASGVYLFRIKSNSGILSGKIYMEK
jgi:hypothetical protein